MLSWVQHEFFYILGPDLGDQNFVFFQKKTTSGHLWEDILYPIYCWFFTGIIILLLLDIIILHYEYV